MVSPRPGSPEPLSGYRVQFPAISHYRFHDCRVIESRMVLFDSAAVAAFLDDDEDR
jgi:hypothetical protein